MVYELSGNDGAGTASGELAMAWTKDQWIDAVGMTKEELLSTNEKMDDGFYETGPGTRASQILSHVQDLMEMQGDTFDGAHREMARQLLNQAKFWISESKKQKTDDPRLR
jgi:hypothetical protein